VAHLEFAQELNRSDSCALHYWSAICSLCR